MKKLVRFLSLLLLLCLALTVPAAAAETMELRDYVTDGAGLLTDREHAALEDTAAALSERYGCGVYIVTVQDYTEYTDGDVRECAEALYTDNDLGLGASRNGEMLLLSMAERDYALIAFGPFGNAAFTDYGKDCLSGKFLKDFAEDNWNGGFETYLKTSGKMLELAAKGKPLDVGSRVISPRVVLIALVLGLLAGWGVTAAAARRSESVREAGRADEYVAPRGVAFTRRNDVFLHTSTTRHYDPPQSRSSSSSGHGGGTTVSSSGFSGKSGKF